MAWFAIVVFGWLAELGVYLAFLAGAAELNERWDCSNDEQMQLAAWEQRRAA